MPTYELGRSTCEREGVDSRGILAFIQKLKERDIHLHTFTMARHGKLIAQVNAFPYKKYMQTCGEFCYKDIYKRGSGHPL